MSEIKMCALCESSCIDDHKYEFGRNRFVSVCDRCWFLIRSIIKEYLLENSTEQVKPKPIKPIPEVKEKKK